MTSSDSNDSLEEATTLTVLVHGIGDHSPVDILTEAEKGLGLFLEGKDEFTAEAALFGYQTTSQWKGSIRVIPKFWTFPNPRESHDDQRAIEFYVDGKKHIILPVVWSGIRQKAGGSFTISQSNALFSLIRAYPALIRACIDSILCVPKATGTGWKSAISLAALLVVGLVLGLISGTSIAIIKLFSWADLVSGTSWLSPFVFGLILTLTLILFDKFILLPMMRVIDLIDDVSSYVVDEALRNRLLDQVADIINNAAALAPKARIMVVGHSLGSVVVTHSLLRPSFSKRDHAGLVLVTMGSPLRLLASIFPQIVHSPRALMTLYKENKSVRFWANVWHVSDVIGQDLRVGSHAKFAEKSLGAGPHWNYWRDSNFWRTLGFLFQMLSEGRVSDLSSAWNSEELSKMEEDELNSRLVLLPSRINLKNYLIGLSWTSFCIYGPFSAFPNEWVRTTAQIFWIAFLICALIMVSIELLIVNVKMTKRKRLEALQRWGELALWLYRSWWRMIQPFMMFCMWFLVLGQPQKGKS